MKLLAVLWDSVYPISKAVSEDSLFECTIHSQREIDGKPDKIEVLKEEMSSADLIILHKTTHGFWDDIIPFVREIRDSKIICFSQDPTYWSLSNVDNGIVSKVYDYIQNGDRDNIENLFRFLENQFVNDSAEYSEPSRIPWQGIVHPGIPGKVYPSSEEYLAEYTYSDRPLIALIVSRSSWITGQNDIEKELIDEIESCGMGVLPIMTNSLHNEEMGSLNIAECLELHVLRDGKSIVKAVVKLVTFLIGRKPGVSAEESSRNADELLSKLNVPVFQPIIALDMSMDEWKDSDGITSDIPWNVTMPEFEGAVEPIMIGTAKSDGQDLYCRKPIPGRAKRIAERIQKRISLSEKPNSEKRLVLLLNNSPCASIEGNIGSAAGLDSIGSVVSILRRLKSEGYETFVPDSPDALIDVFMKRKAFSEFRWTSKESIVNAGGHVCLMSADEYRRYFETIPEEARKKIVESWGEPPGEPMVIDDRIIITGIKAGNVIISVQPKRGCYGARCDGTVCKILHDPECPPSHQYLATYHYFRDVFGADAFVHVGTHGTAEFLPGKGIGLSENCFPDIVTGDVPVFYVYNTDNPPEGSVAKRRIYSTLIGHMQPTSETGGLYGPYLRLEEIINEYEIAKLDPTHSHSLQHEIMDAMEEVGISQPGDHDAHMESLVARTHEHLTLIRNSRIESRLHTFGNIPEKEEEVNIIHSLMRYSREDGSLTRSVSQYLGLDLDVLIQDKNAFNSDYRMSNGALLEKTDSVSRDLVSKTLSDDGKEYDDVPFIDDIRKTIMEIHDRIVSSDELSSLIKALNGNFTPAGPSGYISKGSFDILPTGRNFYSMDSKRVPTRTAWKVGTRLADSLLDKYLDDEGDYPESVAFQWMTNDIMAAEGEMMAEIMSLLGAEPIWSPNGHVTSYRILEENELIHPRIDVTARISGILRDTFPDRIDLIDSLIRDVASLEESDDVNFVRKHVKEEMERGSSFDDSTARIFSSKPGTFASGVNLAVLSGAWKDEKDLAEIYISVNGYAYGKGRNGKESRVQFASALENVSLTFNKTVSDDHDLLGCCCYYSNQGGLTAAARYLSGKKVETYYGDTRDYKDVGVRTLSNEIDRVVRSKVLNPKWIDNMKEHGYKGASDMMKKITRVYGWEASTQEVDDSLFNDIANTYINDQEMRDFFERNNPYAAEEISRRLLEAEARGLWEADEKTLEELRNSYVEIESWMEDASDGGDIQGNEISMESAENLPIGKELAEMMEKIHSRKRK